MALSTEQVIHAKIQSMHFSPNAMFNIVKVFIIRMYRMLCCSWNVYEMKYD